MKEMVMSENTENLVLRTVYLAADVDRHLKRLAFSLNITKNQLIRDILRDGLKAYEGMTVGERLEAAVQPAPRTAAAPARPAPSRTSPSVRAPRNQRVAETA